MAGTTLRWLSVVGIIWLQSVSGTNTDFPAYSSQFKQLLSLSQMQINILAFASDAGKLFGFVPGIAALYLPLWLILLIGSTLNFIAFGVQLLFLTGHVISSLSYNQIFFLTIIAGNSITWINTVCNIATVSNFPSDCQVVVGLTTSYQVLTAKIYTALVDAILVYVPAKRAEVYLFLNAVSPLLVSLMAAPVVRDIGVGNEKRSMKVGFLLLFVITIATGVFAIVSSLGSKSSKLSILRTAITIMGLLLAPLGVALAEKVILFIQGKCCFEREAEVHDITTLEENAAESKSWVKLEEDNGKEVGDGVLHVKEEIGMTLLLQRVDFWLYFFVYLFGGTLGLVYLSNLGQIAESRGCSSGTTLLSLASSFAFSGRLMTALMDYCLSRSTRSMSKPASIGAIMAPMAIAFFLLLNKSNIFLYVSTGIIGVCTGAITSVAVCTTLELFGTKNFGVNHNLVVANIPIGSLVFGCLAALVYSNGENGSGKCMGMQCYSHTFLIWGTLCLLGTSLASALYVRTRKFYSQESKVEKENIGQIL